MKQLIIVENESQIKQACAAAVSDPTAHFAAASAKLGQAIKQRGYICVAFYPEDVFGSKAEVDAFEEEAWALAREWHRDKAFAPAVTYGDLSLGSAVELYMGNALVWTLRNWLWMKQLCAKERPERIICFADSSRVASQFFPLPGEPFAAKMARQLGYKVTLHGHRPRSVSLALGHRSKELARVCVRLAYQRILRPKLKAARPRVLVASAMHHVRSVIAELKKDHDVVYLDESFRITKLDFFKAHHVSYFSYPEIKDGIGAEAKLRLAALRSRLDQSEAALADTLRASKAFYFRDEDISGLITDRLRFFLKQAAYEAALYLEGFRQFTFDQKIDAVLVDEDTVTFRKCLIWASRLNGVRSYQIPHGVSLSDFHYDLFPVSCDRVLVASEGIRQYYVANGVPPSTIDVVGIPRYDELVAQFEPENGRQVRARLGLGPSDRVILFAPTVSLDVSIRLRPFEAEATLRRFAKAMKEIHAKLIVKFHPLDMGSEEKRSVFREMGLTDAIFIGEGDAASLAAASDLVVSFASNLAIECLAFDKPVLWLDAFALSSSHVPYLRSNECDFMVGAAEDLKARIRSALEPSYGLKAAKHGQWFRDHWVGALDGMAGARCAQIIKEGVCTVSR